MIAWVGDRNSARHKPIPISFNPKRRLHLHACEAPSYATSPPNPKPKNPITHNFNPQGIVTLKLVNCINFEAPFPPRPYANKAATNHEPFCSQPYKVMSLWCSGMGTVLQRCQASWEWGFIGIRGLGFRNQGFRV